MLDIGRDPVQRYLSEWKHVKRGATWRKAELRCGNKSWADEVKKSYSLLIIPFISRCQNATRRRRTNQENGGTGRESRSKSSWPARQTLQSIVRPGCSLTLTWWIATTPPP